VRGKTRSWALTAAWVDFGICIGRILLWQQFCDGGRAAWEPRSEREMEFG